MVLGALLLLMQGKGTVAEQFLFLFILINSFKFYIIESVMKMAKKKKATSCLSCENFEYDEERGEEVCIMDLDEDEIYRLSDRESKGCPFYRFRDEYRIVRKQN